MLNAFPGLGSLFSEIVRLLLRGDIQGALNFLRVNLGWRESLSISLFYCFICLGVPFCIKNEPIGLVYDYIIICFFNRMIDPSGS